MDIANNGRKYYNTVVADRLIKAGGLYYIDTRKSTIIEFISYYLQQHSCCLTNCVLTSFGVRWSVTTLSVRPSDIICGWINISTHWYFWSHVLSLYTVSAAYMIQSEPTANVMSFTAWSRQTCLVSYMVQRFCTLSNRLITPVCFWPCLLWSTWPQITFSVWS